MMRHVMALPQDAPFVNNKGDEQQRSSRHERFDRVEEGRHHQRNEQQSVHPKQGQTAFVADPFRPAGTQPREHENPPWPCGSAEAAPSKAEGRATPCGARSIRLLIRTSIGQLELTSHAVPCSGFSLLSSCSVRFGVRASEPRTRTRHSEPSSRTRKPDLT